jgi:enoyl-CoA hydratase/carnithine racemase
MKKTIIWATVSMMCLGGAAATEAGMFDDIMKEVKDTAKQEVDNQVNSAKNEARNQTREAMNSARKSAKDTASEGASGFFSGFKNMFTSDGEKNEAVPEQSPKRTSSNKGEKM